MPIYDVTIEYLSKSFTLVKKSALINAKTEARAREFMIERRRRQFLLPRSFRILRIVRERGKK